MDELTANQRRRALRLLRKAEAEDQAKAEWDADWERRQALIAEKTAAKQEQADDWTRRFHALGLPITARVQVPGSEPEIWMDWPRPERAEDRHGVDVWRTILERLEAANEQENT